MKTISVNNRSPRLAPTAGEPKRFTQLDELLDYLKLDRHSLPDPDALIKNFPLRVPLSFASRMRKGDPCDPLLLQILPRAIENQVIAGFSADPVGDLAAHCAPGLLQKYQSRALLITTGACAIHCRYCFRRHFPYQQTQLKTQHWQQALDYLLADTGLSEVILSGGDPCTLSNRQLEKLLGELDQIAHLNKIRLHTRSLIVEPTRLDNTLLKLFSSLSKTLVIVMHINHANEIDAQVSAQLKRLAQAGIVLLNQSVLLKDINDQVADLIALSEALIQAGVVPYYLHLLDPVAGAAHFEVPKARAIELLESMKTQCAGYLVPRLVQEQAGAPAKTIIA